MEVLGQGSITQLDKNCNPYRCRKWMLQVSTTKGRVSKRFKGSKTEAKDALLLFMDEIDNGNHSKSKKFSEYSKYWLEYRTKCGRYSPNTIETNAKFVKKLNSVFGDIKLTEITPKLVRDSFVSVKKTNNPDEELSGTYKSHMFFTLKAILDMAVADELMLVNPCNKEQPPKKDTKEKSVLDMGMLITLLDCLDQEDASSRVMLIYFMSLLGLRRQEVIALQWEDINWFKHTISINKAYKYGNNTVGETKSRAGKRVLPLPKRLENKIIEWKHTCDENLIESDYICCNSIGKMMTCTAHYQWWHEFLRANGLPKITYHELRHTNLTIMAQKMTPFNLKTYAGWANYEPTKIYIHDDNEAVKQAVNSVDFSSPDY